MSMHLWLRLTLFFALSAGSGTVAMRSSSRHDAKRSGWRWFKWWSSRGITSCFFLRCISLTIALCHWARDHMIRSWRLMSLPNIHTSILWFLYQRQFSHYVEHLTYYSSRRHDTDFSRSDLQLYRPGATSSTFRGECFKAFQITAALADMGGRVRRFEGRDTKCWRWSYKRSIGIHTFLCRL